MQETLLQKTEQRENRLLRNASYLYFINGICSQPLGNLIPFLRAEYNLDYDTSGILLSMLSAGNLLALLFAGFLPLYFGRRISVLLSASWMVVTYIIFAGALRPVVLVVLACFMMGFARGGTSTFSNTMVSTLPDSKTTYGYNCLHGSYAIGGFLSPIILLGAASLWPIYGWRIFSVLLIVITLSQLTVFCRMELPQEPVRSGKTNIDLSFLSRKGFWLTTLLIFCYISAEYAIVGWLVTYFQDIGIFNDQVAQLSNSIFWSTIFIGRFFGGNYSNRIPPTRLLLIDGIGMLTCFLLMFFSRSALPVLIGLVGTGLFMATIFPTAYALGSANFKGNDLGCSMLSFFGSIGSIITPAVVGFVAQQAGIQAGVAVILGVTVLLLFIILLTVWSTHKSDITS